MFCNFYKNTAKYVNVIIDKSIYVFILDREQGNSSDAVTWYKGVGKFKSKWNKKKKVQKKKIKKMKKKKAKKEVKNVKKKKRRISLKVQQEKDNGNKKKERRKDSKQIKNNKKINEINSMTKNIGVCPENWLSGFNQYKKVIIGLNGGFHQLNKAEIVKTDKSISE